MDFLKQCTTTVHQLQGFSVIQYRVYELSVASLLQHMRMRQTSQNESETMLKEYSKVQAIRTAEWTLRNSGILVSANAQMQLWLFDTSQDQLNEKLRSCGHVSDVVLKIDGNPDFKFIRSGSVSAGEILIDPTAAKKTGRATSNVSVDIDKYSASGGDNIRPNPVEALPEDPQYSYSRTYLFFMAACMQSILLHMCATGSVIPLNFRSVAIWNNGRWLLCGLDVSLTPKGDLLVSLNSEASSPGDRITNLLSSNSNGHKTSRLVRLAPSGRLAWVIPSRDSKDALARHERVNAVPAGPSIGDTWRQSVRSILATRNITPELDDGDEAWCRVRLGDVTKDISNRKNNTTKIMDEQGAFDWPKELCFEHGLRNDPDHTYCGLRQAEQTKYDDIGLKYFVHAGQDFWKDPLSDLESFFKPGHPPLRKHDDVVMTGTGSSSDADLDRAVALEEDWEPPLLQHVVTHDMEKAALLYLTPPDGAPPSTASANPGCDHGLNQRKDRVMLSPEVDDEFYGLFQDPAANVTEEDFSYFDQPNRVIEEVHAVSSVLENINGPTTQPLKSSEPLSSRTSLNSQQHVHTLLAGEDKHDRLASLGRPIDDSSPHSSHNAKRDNTGANGVTAISAPHHAVQYHAEVVKDEKYGKHGRFGSLDTNFTNGTNLQHPQSVSSSVSLSNPGAVMNNNSPWKSSQFTAMPVIVSDSESDSSSTKSQHQPDSTNGSRVKRARVAVEDSTSVLNTANHTTTQKVKSSSGQDRANIYHLMFLNMLCRSSPADWSLSAFPAPSGPLSACKTSQTWNSEDFVQIAQLASAQLISSSNLAPNHCTGSWPPLELQDIVSPAKCVSVLNSSSCEALRTEVCELDVIGNATLESIIRQPSTAKFQPKPVLLRKAAEQRDLSEVSTSDSAVFGIPPPMLRVQRHGNEIWELSPPACAFWDVLDLAPVHGPKHVRALCVYPENLDVLRNVTQFFRVLSTAWQNGRLGNHELLKDIHVGRSLIPVSLQSSTSLRSAVEGYRLACLELAKELRLYTPREDESIIVYIVSPFETENALFDLCACFHGLVKKMSPDIEDQDDVSFVFRDRIVLQIIPIRMIVSDDALNLRDPQIIGSLCREVYSRCPGRLDNIEGLAPSNAIELTEDVMRDFTFHLSGTISANPLQDNSCLHIAYCRSHDDLWTTAAWTDNRGGFQHQASYYMGKGQKFNNIAREIWESTLEFTSSRKVHWRFFVASAAPMPLPERKIWRDLAIRTKPTSDGWTFNLTLVSTNTAPTFQIYPKTENGTIVSDAETSKAEYSLSTTLPVSSPMNIAANTTFPLSTTTTPAGTAAPTPMSMPDAFTPRRSSFPTINTIPPVSSIDNDPSTRLIDLTDETWGIVLSRRLSVGRAVIDYHPALSSGYLVKRTGVNNTDIPVVLEVNIMAVDLVPAGTIPRVSGEAARQQVFPKQPTAPNPARQTAQRPFSIQPSKDLHSLSSSREENANAASDEEARRVARQKRYDASLREVLVMYRRLALLAKVRGLQDMNGTVPWHVLVASRVAEGLRRCAGVPDSWK